MTKFNPEDCLSPAMSIVDKADAQQYKRSYIDFCKKSLREDHKFLKKVNESGGNMETMLEEEATYIVNSNLGYYAGYGSNELRERVERLFECSHPIFGKVTDGIPTPKEAHEMGLKMNKR